MRISDWSSDVCSSDLPYSEGPEATGASLFRWEATRRNDMATQPPQPTPPVNPPAPPPEIDPPRPDIDVPDPAPQPPPPPMPSGGAGKARKIAFFERRWINRYIGGMIPDPASHPR